MVCNTLLLSQRRSYPLWGVDAKRKGWCRFRRMGERVNCAWCVKWKNRLLNNKYGGKEIKDSQWIRKHLSGIYFGRDHELEILKECLPLKYSYLMSLSLSKLASSEGHSTNIVMSLEQTENLVWIGIHASMNQMSCTNLGFTIHCCSPTERTYI